MTAFPEGYERRVLLSVDSTLDEARRLLPVLSGPTWILSLEQTAARGRRGRAWASLSGNFAATLVLPVPNPGQGALRSFVAALALREACVEVTGRTDDFALKWPNDVLLRDRKLAGILLEGYDTDRIGIGIGVNLAVAPAVQALETGALPPISLRDAYGLTIAPEDFLTSLARAFARFETQMQSLGFAPIRTAWLAHASRLGAPITARTGRDTQQGRFVDVDLQGQLVLETPKGRVAIPAADVYF